MSGQEVHDLKFSRGWLIKQGCKSKHTSKISRELKQIQMKTFYRRNDLMDFSKLKVYLPALEVITCLFNEGIKMFVS